jgi:hypothetical protein
MSEQPSEPSPALQSPAIATPICRQGDGIDRDINKLRPMVARVLHELVEPGAGEAREVRGRQVDRLPRRRWSARIVSGGQLGECHATLVEEHRQAGRRGLDLRVTCLPRRAVTKPHRRA